MIWECLEKVRTPPRDSLEKVWSVRRLLKDHTEKALIVPRLATNFLEKTEKIIRRPALETFENKLEE